MKEDRKRAMIALLCLFLVGGFSPVSAGEDAMNENVYNVPPNFFDNLAVMEPPVPKPQHRKALERVGVQFPEGARVIHNRAKSQIIVRNTKEQLDRIEKVIDLAREVVAVQVLLTVQELVCDRAAFETNFPRPADPQSPSPEKQTPGRNLDSVDGLLAELAQPPRESDKAGKPDSTSSIEFGLCGVFTDPQSQLVLEKLSQSEDVDMSDKLSVMARPGQPCLIEASGSRWGMVPVTGGDEFTIDLAAYIPPPGEALDYAPGEKKDPTVRVTIWDGQTIAYSEKLDDGRVRMSFITARLLDPAGMPLHPKEEKPESSAEEQRNADEKGATG